MCKIPKFRVERLSALPHNNPGAADDIKILAVMQRWSVAADQER